MALAAEPAWHPAQNFTIDQRSSMAASVPGMRHGLVTHKTDGSLKYRLRMPVTRVPNMLVSDAKCKARSAVQKCAVFGHIARLSEVP